ncbi:MAG: glycosyltransferase [Oscillospiraceae bacterium]|nr:glycosyltransferase [Oscillospiraceae bacterium]
MPKITVVITTYNLEKFIAKSLDELFAQTFQDFNILVIDDCSEDSTVDIVREYMAQFSDRIVGIFLEENLGMPGLTRNFALDSGKIDGEFIVFLDGDDSVEPEYLEILYAMVQKPNTDIAVCAYDRVEYKTGDIQCVEMQGFPEVIEKPYESNILAFINTSAWNKIIRTALIEDIRFSKFSVGEEVCFLLRLYAKCSGIRFTNQVLIHYQIHSSSVISNTKLADIHAFAAEFVKLHDETSELRINDTVELAAFLHIGLSMAIRAKDNPDINAGEHASWTRYYFSKNFAMFKKSRLLKFSSLCDRGVRGLAIWACLFLYRIRSFSLFLLLYGLYRKITRKDVKF